MKNRRIAITGSKWHRVWQCPPSAILPQIIDDAREARTEPARGRGRSIHTFLENVKAVGKEQALAEAPQELLPLLSALDIASLPVHLSTEVAFALNMLTGAVRELGRNLGHRDYHLLENPPTDDEIAFTSDVIGTQETEKGVFGFVGDYKSGWTKYPAPDKFGQTILGALAVRALYGCLKVVVELIYLDDDGNHYAVRRVMDDWDLDIAERSFLKAWKELDRTEEDFEAGRPLAYHEGHHCDFCGARKNCQAKVGMIKAMPAELVRMGIKKDDKTGELELTPGLITRETAGNMFVAAERLREVLGKVMQEVCNLGWEEPIPLADGRVIERYITRKRDVDGRKAATVLEKLYGRDKALTAIQIDVTLDAIRKLVVANKREDEKIQTKKGDGALDKVLKQIEALGGIANNVSEACKPHMPTKRKG